MAHHRLTLWIIGAGLAGALLAWAFGDPHWVTSDTPPAFYEAVLLLKSSFLALLKMLIAPVIFVSLIAGLVSLGDAAKLKTLGGTTVVYYLATTTIAILIGLFVVAFIHPWESSGAAFDVSAFGGDAASGPRLIDPGSESLLAVLTSLLDSALVNPVAAMAELNILGIVANALLIGLALVLAVPAESPLIQGVKDLNLLIGRLLSWLILTLPFGVFAVIFDFTLKADVSMLVQLGAFAGVVFGATMVHGLVVLPLIAWRFGGMGPREFFAGAARPLLVAFSTSSSAATLPVSIEAAEDRLGVSPATAGFVLPLGATMNMDGTALFEGIAAVFLAYLFGIELSTIGLVTVFLMAMIASIGAPGMPSASMAGMQMVLLAVGIPLEAIAILLVIERPLDTFRTAVNVEGDLVGTLVVERRLQAAADMSRLLLVRHGQIDANTRGDWHGSTDSPLNETGRRQIDAVARYLVGEPVRAVYSSPLQRTFDTAAAIAAAQSLEARPDARLREYGIGELEGTNYRQLEEDHSFFSTVREDPQWAPRGGESIAGVLERMTTALAHFVDDHRRETVVVVSHGAALAIAIAHLVDGDVHRWHDYHPANCSVSELGHGDGGRWELGRYDVTEHLD